MSGFGGEQDESLPVRKEASPLVVQARFRKRPRIPRTGGNERDLVRVLVGRQSPAAVAREGEPLRLRELDRLRSVGPANVAVIVLPPGALLVEQDRVPVVGDVVGKGPVEPGEVALLSVGGRRDDLAALARAPREHRPVRPHVFGNQIAPEVDERLCLPRRRNAREPAAE